MRPDHASARDSESRTAPRPGAACPGVSDGRAVLLACVIGLLPPSLGAQPAEPPTIVVSPDAGVSCNPAPCPAGVQVRTSVTRSQDAAPASPSAPAPRPPVTVAPPAAPVPAPVTPAPAAVRAQSPTLAQPQPQPQAQTSAPSPAQARKEPPALPQAQAPAVAPAAPALPPLRSAPAPVVAAPRPSQPSAPPAPVVAPAVVPAAAPAAALPAAPTPASAARAPVPLPTPGIRVRNWLREAVDSHPTILSAQQRLGAAISEVEFARWQFFPTPSVGFEAAARDVSGASNQQTGFVRLQQPLYTGGRLTQQLSRATAGSRASAFAVDEERRTIALRMVQALGDARAAAIKRQAYRESAASHVDFLGLVQRRVSEGLSPRGDVVLARSRLSSVRADLEAAEVQMDQALSRLEQLLGRSLDAVEYAALRADDVDDATADWPVPTVDRLLPLALQASPAVSRGLAELEARRADIGMARASLGPQVYLRAEHSRGSTGAGQSQLYLGVGSNFGAGLSDRSTISAAERRLQSQQAEVDALRRDLVEQVRSEHTLAVSGERRVGVLSDSANYAATVVEAWQRQFLAGRKSWQELMNAAREKAQADALLGEAKAARWVSMHRLRLLAEGVDDFLGLTIKAPEKVPGTS